MYCFIILKSKEVIFSNSGHAWIIRKHALDWHDCVGGGRISKSGEAYTTNGTVPDLPLELRDIVENAAMDKLGLLVHAWR